MENAALILLGFMTCAWLFTVAAGAYLFWRYVHAPWKVVRADQVALNNAFLDLKAEVTSELGLRKAFNVNDAEREQIERAQRFSTVRQHDFR